MKKSLFIKLCAVIVTVCTATISLTFCASSDRRSADPLMSAQTVGKGDRRDICNVLLLGRDESAGLTDVIMVVSFDMTNSSAAVLQIPRDTYAEYTSDSYKKLNGAYSRLGAKGLCEFLSQSLCVDINYYAVVDLDALGDIVDMLGGVEVDVPFDLDYEDSEQGLYIHLKKGRQLLDGKSAGHFVRYRSGYAQGDVGRIDAQKMFLSAFIKRVKEKASVLTVGAIAISLLDDVNTNFPLPKLISVLGKAVSIDDGAITLLTLPGAAAIAKKSGASYYVMSRESALEALRRYFGILVASEDFDKSESFLNESYGEFSCIYHSSVEYSAYNVRDVQNGALGIEHN